jgi:hypothetical protein
MTSYFVHDMQVTKIVFHCEVWAAKAVITVQFVSFIDSTWRFTLHYQGAWLLS